MSDSEIPEVPRAGSGYSLAGWLATAEQAPEAWAAMLRCRSCACLLLAEDQAVHEGHHTRLDEALAAPELDRLARADLPKQAPNARIRIAG